jgi:Cysteine rich repeat
MSLARAGALGAALLLALAACKRESPPEYMPEPPPAPAATDGRLTIDDACASDIERFCTGVPPPQGSIMECMKPHLSELSPDCFDAVSGAIASE